MSPKTGVAPLRRAAIVQATIRCLARDGYVGLTMKRVAAEAGVSPGILHYYFRDKRAILTAAAVRVTADLDRRVAAGARGVRDARGRLRVVIRAGLEAATRDRDFWTVFIALWGETLRDRRLSALNRRSYARVRRLIAGGVARGIAEGAFRRVDPAEAAAVILAILDGLSLQLTFEPGLMPARRAVRLGEEALLRYLTPVPERGGAPCRHPTPSH